MQPKLNLAEISEYEKSQQGNFQEKYFGISDKIGAKKLGYSISIIEPGYKACPFHNHQVGEEMFLILEGKGTLRYGDKEYAIKKDDIIACPPGGQEHAHQIINTSNHVLRILCVGTNEEVDVCEYPDSNKTMTMVGEPGNRRFRHISMLDNDIDYYQNEI